jgi:hypothetical protein
MKYNNMRRKFIDDTMVMVSCNIILNSKKSFFGKFFEPSFEHIVSDRTLGRNEDLARVVVLVQPHSRILPDTLKSFGQLKRRKPPEMVHEN